MGLAPPIRATIAASVDRHTPCHPLPRDPRLRGDDVKGSEEWKDWSRGYQRLLRAVGQAPAYTLDEARLARVSECLALRLSSRVLVGRV